jgi:hypothetical protein
MAALLPPGASNLATVKTVVHERDASRVGELEKSTASVCDFRLPFQVVQFGLKVPNRTADWAAHMPVRDM